MNKTRGEVYADVRDILVEALPVEREEIKEESYLIRDLDAASIDLVDVWLRLEKKYKIKIPKGDIFPVFNGEHEDYPVTVSSIVDYIESKLRGAEK